MAGTCRGHVVLAGLLAMLLACRSVSLPPNDRPFAKGSACGEIQGCFAERGEAAAGEPLPRLSAELWPDAVADDSITLVSFEPTDGGSFVVRALSDGRVVRERRLEGTGRRAGPIRLSGGRWFPPFTQEGEEPPPLVGAYGEKVELGLDVAGNLELRRRGWTVGLVYLVVPVVFRVETQLRFARVACREGEPVVAP